MSSRRGILFAHGVLGMAAVVFAAGVFVGVPVVAPVQGWAGYAAATAYFVACVVQGGPELRMIRPPSS